MRPIRILVPMVVWMAAGALPGCRPAEPARVESEIQVPVEPAAVVVSRDTQTIDSSGMIVTVTENTPEDTAARPEEHNDCRYVGTRRQAKFGEPGFGDRYDPAVMKSGVPFRCRLRPDGPEVKLVLSGEMSIPEFVDVHSPADAPRPMQRLVLDNSEGAYEGSELLVGEDLNGDGWMDLYVFTYSGSAGRMSDVFRYEPSARRFVPDTALPGMNVRRLPGRPRCVGVSHKTSAWDHTGGEYCWRGGTWVKVRAYAQDGLRDGRLVRTEEALRGGRMVVVSVDTITRDGPDERLPE